MTGESEEGRGQAAPKAADSGPKPKGQVASMKVAGKKNAEALAAALRANLARRKARERALREDAQRVGDSDVKTDSEG